MDQKTIERFRRRLHVNNQIADFKVVRGWGGKKTTSLTIKLSDDVLIAARQVPQAKERLIRSISGIVQDAFMQEYELEPDNVILNPPDKGHPSIVLHFPREEWKNAPEVSKFAEDLLNPAATPTQADPAPVQADATTHSTSGSPQRTIRMRVITLYDKWGI